MVVLPDPPPWTPVRAKGHRVSRMIGRSGERRTISTNPAAANVLTYPVPVALGETEPPSGYAPTIAE